MRDSIVLQRNTFSQRDTLRQSWPYMLGEQ